MIAPILAVNVGSSSLKLSVIGGDGATVVRRETVGEFDLSSEVAQIVASSPALAAVGHRVVHGGHGFSGPAEIDAAVESEIARLSELAPLHNPPALAAIRTVRDLLPDLPAFACFDTAFHRTLPEAASEYALPAAWREQWDLRRVGFHGLSHAYSAKRVAELLDRPASSIKLVSAHLGSGASLAAIEGGRSVDTTMGFTPMDGIVMATRPGSLDPGLLLWVMRQTGMGPKKVEDQLESSAGLLGLSGRSGNMKDLIAAEGEGDERARLAIAVYVHRLAGAIAAMAAAMNGINALSFTGGVGENADIIRSRTCEALGFIGVQLLPEAPAAESGDSVISEPNAPVTVLLVACREDAEMAAQISECMSTS